MFGCDNIKGAVIAVERSGNSKLGSMSATYGPLQTCPESCGMKEECYAQKGLVGMIFQRLTKNANGNCKWEGVPVSQEKIIWLARMEAKEIGKLSGRRPLRVHISGDCNDSGAAVIVAQAMVEYEKKMGQPAWTTTHAWREIPREAWGEARVLASVESRNDVFDAQRHGYSAIVVVDGHLSDRGWEDYGVRFVPCPHDTRGVRCKDCRLCGVAGKTKGGMAICLERF